MFNQEFRNFVYYLQHSKNTDEVYNEYKLISVKYPNTKVVISVDNETNIFISPVLKINFENIYLRSYYSSEKLFFLDRETINRMQTHNEIKLNLEYSIFADTNFASDIHKFLHRKKLGQNQKDIISLIDHLLFYNLDFNVYYYILENTKLIIRIYNRHKNKRTNYKLFWLDIKKERPQFCENLISLILFINIDKNKYRKSPSLKSTISEKEAEEQAMISLYKTYFADNKKNLILAIRNQFYHFYLLTIKILQINFASRSLAKDKLLELINFMHNKLGYIAEREMIIAFNYFSNEKKAKEFFQTINRGKQTNYKKLQKKIQNLVWDLMLPRFIEDCLRSQEQEKFFLPYLVTSDKKLSNLLDLYPIRGSVIEATSHQVISLPEENVTTFLQSLFNIDTCTQYFSQQAANYRTKVKDNFDKNPNAIFKLIKTEFKQLQSILYNN